MHVSSITFLTGLLSLVDALPGLQRRQVIQWVTEEATATVDQVVATAYTTVPGSTPTQMVVYGKMEQEQVIVNEITVEYTYSSARTIFVVPTIVSSVVTTLATVTAYVTEGSTVIPSATATITNSINAQATPVGSNIGTPVTATLPLVSVLIGGATVTVSEQTYTYYTPVLDVVGNTIAPSATISATPTAEVVSSVPLLSSGSPVEFSSGATGIATTSAISTGSPSNQGSTSIPSQSSGSISSSSGSAIFGTISPSSSSVYGQASSSATISTLTPSSTSSVTPSSMSSSSFATLSSLATSSSGSPSSTQSTATSQTSAASSVISESSQDSFVTSLLNSMNTYRSLHSAPALVWNYTLAESSLSYAQSCVMSHSQDPAFGETLAAGTATDPTFYVDLWYAEGANYDYSNPGFSDATGHFTQLIWVGTTSVGCGFSSGCGQYPDYLVCRYNVAGNVVGGTNNDEYFIGNVLP